jgi:uncharacterized protein (TIGR01777 family)
VKVLVTGSHGFIGSALVRSLEAGGHVVVRLVRSDPGPGDVLWDPLTGRIDAGRLEGIDGVVNLAGHGIGRPWWTAGHKARVLDSRVRGTTLLAETAAALPKPPAVIVSGSSVGYYGSRGDEILTESSEPGDGFLAEVVGQWEAATAPASDAGIRVVLSRSGTFVVGKGGAVPPMLIPFRIGFGGRSGSGKQWWSWISLADEVGAITHLLENEEMAGPVILASPNPVTNAEFARALGRVMHRPSFFPTPPALLKAAMGPEMAAEMVLVSQRAMPERLLASGYRFVHTDVEAALRAALAA